MPRPEDRELVPLRPGFDVVWHGFDRAQVKQYLDDLDAEIKLLVADRDAALSQVADLTEQLTSSHSRIAELSKQMSELVELPKDTADLDERCTRMVRLARHQAEEVTARAQAAATHAWAGAEDAASELRSTYENLLTELDKQRQHIRGQHDQIVEQTRATVAEMTTTANHRQQDLDQRAEQRRRRIEDEFERSMADKRQALAKEIEQQRAASRAEADRRIREAAAEGQRLVAAAAGRVQDLQGVRMRVAEQMRSAHSLILDAAPLLEPLEDESSVTDEKTTSAPRSQADQSGQEQADQPVIGAQRTGEMIGAGQAGDRTAVRVVARKS